MRCRRRPCVAHWLFNSGNDNQHDHHDARHARHLDHHHGNSQLGSGRVRTIAEWFVG
jgi:hypothetical protein